MIENILPNDSAPCRSCAHEREGDQSLTHKGYLGGFECLANEGFCPKSFLTYGVSSKEEGQKLCTDYVHYGFDW